MIHSLSHKCIFPRFKKKALYPFTEILAIYRLHYNTFDYILIVYVYCVYIYTTISITKKIRSAKGMAVFVFDHTIV
jgi:hypothetical protein